MIRAALSVALAAALVSCGTPARCTPTSCKGCCSNDVCLDGNTTSACGRSGAECETCAVPLVCLAGACSSAGGGTGGSSGGAGGSSGGSAGGTGGGTAGGATGGGSAGGSAGATAGGSAGGTASPFCDFFYRVTAVPSSQTCLTASVSWPNPLMRFTQHADGGLTLTVDGGVLDGGAPIGTVLPGSWADAGSISTFAATGQATLTYSSINIPVMNSLMGRFADCDRWTARWSQTSTLCNLTWDVTAIRQ